MAPEFNIPELPGTDTTILEHVDLKEAWEYTRMTFFYQKILGYNRNIRIDLRRNVPKAVNFVKEVEALRDQIIEEDLINLKAIYRFLPAHSDGDDTIVTADGKDYVFHFPRQEDDPHLCLSDYLQPQDDSMGFLVGTAGSEILNYAKELEADGLYKNAFIFQGIALGAAEALTEMVHHKMRLEWGLKEPEWDKSLGPPRKYRGQRYSFGYPACPELEMQGTLWDILQPQKIGVELTESFIMDPEASVSCIVYHHPDAKYFSV